MHPLPAHRSKHIPLLRYPFQHCVFNLTQVDDGNHNGTALWLGAQCLSAYLASTFTTLPRSRAKTPRPRAIELGSGIGLSALALAAQGWDVCATDTDSVVNTVLSNNVARNLSELPRNVGRIDVRVLDWMVLPQDWIWDDATSITPSQASHSAESHNPSLPSTSPPFDLILSADTVYSPALVTPLLRSLHYLASSCCLPTSCPVYLCLERRDGVLVDSALAEARDKWGFSAERVMHRKISKAIKRSGLNWDSEDWDGVEIWRMILKTKEWRSIPPATQDEVGGDQYASER